MKWLFNEEHIFLEHEEVQKVCRLIEKELGITNIKAINADLDRFEIVRVCTDENDSLTSNIRDVKIIKSVNAFNNFCKRYGQGEGNGKNKS